MVLLIVRDSITEVSSGTAHNVIPGRTTATIDIRVPLGESTDKIRAKVESVVETYRQRVADAVDFDII